MSKNKSSLASTSNGNEFGTKKTSRLLLGKVPALNTNGKDDGDFQVKKWTEDIGKFGYGRCLKNSCSFTSSSVSNLEKHHRTCVELNDSQCINYQNNFSNSIKSHAAVCSPQNCSGSKQMNGDKSTRCKKWKKQIKTKGKASCGNTQCNFVGVKLSDLEDHYKSCSGVADLDVFCCIHCRKKFTKKEEHSEHERSCVSNEKPNDESGEKDKMLHFKVIQKMKDRDSNEDHIIQPGPDLPRGAYTRRRPYSAQHKNSWKIALEKCKYVKCMFQNCYFLAMSLEDMISHFGYCNGDGSFAKFVCPHCKGRVTSEAVLAKHLERSHVEEMKNSAGDEVQMKTENKEVEESAEGVKTKISGFVDDDILEVPDVELLRRPVSLEEKSKSPRTYSKRQKISSEKDKSIEKEKVEEKKPESPPPEPKKRGRKPKNQDEVIPNGNPKSSEKSKEEVECGKCGEFRGTRKNFEQHNIKKHVGLGWVQGEAPVDLDNEKEVIRLVKMAFKVTKKGICEVCKDVRKSFLGFATHVQNCGKSEEERNTLKVQCPHCPGKYLKYSLPVHIKLSHTEVAEEEGTGEPKKEEDPGPSGKRRSAIKAVSKFQEVLKENEDPEVQESNYFVYEKESEKFPKTCSRLINLWYKLKREKKKIPCDHENCDVLSDEVKQAKHHHFTCPQLPDKVFMCETCGFYSPEESSTRSHVTKHRRIVKRRRSSAEKVKSEDEEEYEEDEEKEEEDEEGEDEEEEEVEEEEGDGGERPKKRKRKQDDDSRKKRKLSSAKPEVDLDYSLRLNFCRRGRIENVRGFNFYSAGLEMTLKEETTKEEISDPWPQLHTETNDWTLVSTETAKRVLPNITESISVCFNADEKWRRFKQLEGDIIDEVPVMFTGGSVRSMSWCKVSHKRMVERSVRQYLAVATAKGFEKLTNIHELPSEYFRSNCLQIWDCGVLDNSPAIESPKFVLGIISDGGDVRELSWFPEDTSAEGKADRLSRIGIVAAASEDGAVRVWAVPDPRHLEHSQGVPVYKAEPVIKLITDEDLVDGCLRLSVARGGTIAGGYANGTVAVWNLNNVSSPFCRRQGKCRILKPHLTIQAHRTAITALTFRPESCRYVSTAALDRTMKVWDLDSPAAPVDQFAKELCLENVWLRNWPLVIYNYDDIVTNLYKGAVRFARDFLPERRQSCLILENTCLSITFSDWLNALCGSSNAGDVKFRLLKNFIGDQKIKEKNQTTISSLRMVKLNGTEEEVKKTKEEGKCEVNIETTYEEVSSKFGLTIKDNVTKDVTKPKKSQVHPEEFPIRAVNKVCFNPNLRSFTHIAVGYNCGLIRIQCLKELQSNRTLQSFLENAANQTLIR